MWAYGYSALSKVHKIVYQIIGNVSTIYNNITDQKNFFKCYDIMMI